MDNQNNNCNCNSNPAPAPLPPVDIDMQVHDRNIDALPALQVYTTKVLKPNTRSMQHQHKNILTQEMVCCEDCKYVIRWKYDLNGQTIEIPENCILVFDGGSLNNGTVVGQNTVFINLADVTIWGDNLTREGTWREGGGGIKPGDLDDYYTKEEVDHIQDNLQGYTDRKVRESNDRTDRGIASANNLTDTKLAGVKNDYLDHAAYIDDNALKDINGNVIKPETITGHIVNGNGTPLDTLIGNKADKSDTYTKDEVASILSRVPESDVIVVNALPSPDVPDTSIYENKLYRVVGTDSYSEWGWNGSAFVKLAEYDHGIDNTPDDDSDNLIKSKAVAELIKKGPSDMQLVIADKTGTVFGYIRDDNKLVWMENIVTKDIELENKKIITGIDSIEDSGFMYGVMDKTGALILFIKDDESYVHGNNKEDSSVISDVYERNMDKDDILFTASWYGNPNKKLQLLVATDTHDNITELDNAAIAASKFKSIDALIHLGDACTYYPRTYDVGGNLGSKFDMLLKSSIPTYFVVGNHDKGESSRAIEGCLSDREIYDMTIRKMVKKGYLVEGEYQEDRLYYFHDFDSNKVRLIVLDEYDDQCFAPSDVTHDYSNFIQDNGNWRPVAYNSNYPLIAIGSYNTGDKVNLKDFTEFSFEARHNVTISHYYTYLTHAYNEELPCYKSIRDNTWYGERQLNWFVQTLKGAAAKGYTVVIAQHDSFTLNSEIEYNDDFTQYNSPALGKYMNKFVGGTADDDIIAKIVNAFKTGSSLNGIQMTPHSGEDPRCKDGDYTLYDDSSAIPSFAFSCAFDTPATINCVFICGHYHRDAIFHHSEYGLKGATFISGMIENGYDHDVFRNTNDSKTMDALTAITVYDSNLHLCRIGNDKALKIGDDGIRIISKENEFINF